MAVLQATIKKQINVLIEQTKALKQPESQEAFANGLATIVTNAILSAEVLIAIGAVVTTGGPATQTNATPVLGSLQ